MANSFAMFLRAWRSRQRKNASPRRHPFEKDPLAPLVETARRLEYGAGLQANECCTDAVSDRGDPPR